MPCLGPWAWGCVQQRGFHQSPTLCSPGLLNTEFIISHTHTKVNTVKAVLNRGWGRGCGCALWWGSGVLYEGQITGSGDSGPSRRTPVCGTGVAPGGCDPHSPEAVLGEKRDTGRPTSPRIHSKFPEWQGAILGLHQEGPDPEICLVSRCQVGVSCALGVSFPSRKNL